DDQKFCVPVHGSSTAAQNVGGLFVGPVVQNPLQQVEVTACRYFTEEVPAHHRTPIGKALLPDPFPCKVCGPGGVEDDSVGLGFVVQDRAQQSPRTTSDVDDPGGFREIVGIEYGGGHGAGQFLHRLVEQASLFGVMHHVVVDVLARHGGEGGLARAEAVVDPVHDHGGHHPCQ